MLKKAIRLMNRHDTMIRDGYSFLSYTLFTSMGCVCVWGDRRMCVVMVVVWMEFRKN